ncbi:MAG: phosphoribosylformylglycinamidine cyclo-ligase [Candidatus Kariarchaeaceae archaeon]|jgi:phosphoribosylformylglycinamidine cyclo-ligase
MKRYSTYEQAGVNRQLEEESVKTIIEMIEKKSEFGMGSIRKNLFAGAIPFGDFLFSMATDGVGSKVILSEELEQYDTIGIDCVAMNVNDLIAIGSIPAAFVDYIAIREPEELKIKELVKGIIDGCNQSNIPLIGGETAILPEVIAGPGNRFDLAGTALGIQHKDSIISGQNIKYGDVIIGIQSSGIHSNGLTLARKLFEADEIEWKKRLLIPTRIYVKCIKELLDLEYAVKGMAHITGGGFRNLLRLGKFHYQLESWPIPDLFMEMKERGKITDREMFETFNQGIGYTLIVSPDIQDDVLKSIHSNYEAQIIGKILEGDKVSIGPVILNR